MHKMTAHHKPHRNNEEKVIYKYIRLLGLFLLALSIPVSLWAIQNPKSVLNQFAGNEENVSSLEADIEATKTTYEVPVAIIMFLPDENKDGIVDPSTGYTGYYDFYTKKSYGKKVDDLRQHIMDDANNAVKITTEATKYHGYKDENAVPSLKFKIMDDMIFEEKNNPPAERLAWGRGPARRPDYNNILNKYKICDLVDNKGLKEVWMWTQHNSSIEPTESNFSSKLSGDISNSERYQDDLPICNKSYTLYNYNFTRSIAEVLHNRGHQLEHLFNEWPKRDTLAESEWKNLLFWGKFVGSEKDQQIHRPGCGWIHFPPSIPDGKNCSNNPSKEFQNCDYNYTDTLYTQAGKKIESIKPRESDCEDWKPDGSGEKKMLSCSVWNKYFYNSETCGYDSGLSFFVWWMQNIPGYGNDLYHNGLKLRNWWDYQGDFDSMYKSGKFLYASVSASTSDKVKPSVEIVTPAAGSMLPEVAIIKTTAKDDKSIVSHKILVDNTGYSIYQLKDCGSSETCEYSLNLNTLKIKSDEKPTEFVIVVEAKDADGNLGRKYIPVNVDNKYLYMPFSISNLTAGAELTADNVNMQINPGKNALGFNLSMGNSSCSKEYSDYNYVAIDPENIKSQDYSIKNLPTDGRNLYACLTTFYTNKTSELIKYTFKAVKILVKVQALVTEPSALALESSSVTIKWSQGQGIKGYKLYVGKTASSNEYGPKDEFNTTKLLDSSVLFYKVDNLPVDGSSITARLESIFEDNTSLVDTKNYLASFKAIEASRMITPANGSKITFPLELKWEKIDGAERYHIYIGSSPVAFDYYYKSQALQTGVTINKTDLSKEVPIGQKLYVTLWTRDMKGIWKSNRYEYDYVEKGSVVTVTAKGSTKILNSNPILYFYINKNYTNRSIEVLPSDKIYTIELPKVLVSGDELQLVFMNDTKNGDKFDTNRDISMNGVTIDGVSVNLDDSNRVRYDRANREDNTKYVLAQDWGNLPEGLWGNEFEAPKFSPKYMWWNGAIRITIK